MSVNNFWPIKIKGDVTVCVQPTIHQMSSYVLLEQEDWFEDEMDFIRAYIQPDMNALDIGANHGVYALSIAKNLTSGHVWAFEPTIAPRSKLIQSVEINNFSNLITIVDAGLSNKAATAEISISVNSELNSLYGKGEDKETINLLALDEYIKSTDIKNKFDFVKLDAEGEEINVLRGGKDFFTQQSPLIMFELKHGNEINHGLIDSVKSYGYKIFRLLPDVNILVEYDDSFNDGYLLNLFACKPDRADLLSNSGLLATNSQVQNSLQSNFSLALDWVSRLKDFPYFKECASVWMENIATIPPNYIQALSACLHIYDENLSASQRVALLIFANNSLEELIKNDKNINLAVWLLKIHLLHISGFRSLTVNLIDKVSNILNEEETPIWPFLPPSKNFLSSHPIQGVGFWLKSALLEFKEMRYAFSSYFVNNSLGSLITQLKNPNHSIALERRALLVAKRINNKISIPDNHQLFNEKISSNAKIWRLITDN